MSHIIELKNSHKIKQHIKWNKEMLDKNQTVWPPPNYWPQRRRAGSLADLHSPCRDRRGTQRQRLLHFRGRDLPPRPRRHPHSQDAIGLSLFPFVTSPWQAGLTKCGSDMSVKERERGARTNRVEKGTRGALFRGREWGRVSPPAATRTTRMCNDADVLGRGCVTAYRQWVVSLPCVSVHLVEWIRRDQER
jgi:hypothetical protein